MITRRGFLGGILAAPAIIKIPGLLMPVKAWQPKRHLTAMVMHGPPWTNSYGYTVAPDVEKIWLGDLMVLGPDGYVRPWTSPYQKVIGAAVTIIDNDIPRL